ncbi:MAG: hypothetical protein RIM99_03240 [Cyclobacteriaceae bacterium]
MKRYLIVTSIVSALLFVGYFLFESFYGGILHSKFPFLIGFFYVQSFPIAWMLRQGEKDRSSFVIYAIGSIGFRMITGLFLLLVFFFMKVDQIIEFAIQFSAVYLVYLVFELIVVLANLRRN